MLAVEIDLALVDAFEAHLVGIAHVGALFDLDHFQVFQPVSYTHLRAHETVLDLVCRLLLEKKKH